MRRTLVSERKTLNVKGGVGLELEEGYEHASRVGLDASYVPKSRRYGFFMLHCATSVSLGYKQSWTKTKAAIN